jgi:hypothetical protein
MKRAGRVFVTIGIGLVVIAVILAGVGTWFVRRPWPQVSGTITVSGLSGPGELSLPGGDAH